VYPPPPLQENFSSQRIVKLCRTSKKHSGLGKMHLDLYTSNSALTHKAKFWCNYVGALKDRGPDGLLVLEDPIRPRPRPSIWSLYRPVDITMYDLMYEDDWRKWGNWHKGSQDLRAPDDRIIRSIHPSIVETLPEEFPDLKHEFSRLESQMFDRPKRPGLVPLTPVLPEANDRIHSIGYAYNPVHTEIYGTFRNNAKRAL